MKILVYMAQKVIVLQYYRINLNFQGQLAKMNSDRIVKNQMCSNMLQSAIYIYGTQSFESHHLVF